MHALGPLTKVTSRGSVSAAAAGASAPTGRSHRRLAKPSSSSSSSPTIEQPVFPLHLPGVSGGIWLDRSALSQDIVYGQNFILSRPRRGGPGLVISPRQPPLARTFNTKVGSDGRKAAPSSLAVRAPAGNTMPATTRARGAGGAAQAPPTPLSLPGGPSAIEITDYRVVGGGEEEWEGEEGGEEEVVVWALPAPAGDRVGPPAAATTPTTTPALAPPAPSSSAAAPTAPPGPIRIDIHAAAAALTPHPRRTGRLAFTCKLCGARTTIAFNPAASVLARCGGAAGAAAAEAALGGTPPPEGGPCGVIHLLADNLKLFSELSGPLFPGGGLGGGGRKKGGKK